MNDNGNATYKQLIQRFRDVVCRAVPPDATVVVVSKGDPELLKLENRRAWHFPQREDGEYAGYYPADSTETITHLESLRAKGADFLVFPIPAFWWLKHYSAFTEHLESHYRLIVREDDTCLAFALREPPMPQAEKTEPLTVLAARQQLNDRITKVARTDWCHRFEIDRNNNFVPAENLRFRVSVLTNLFETLFKEQTVFVLNETSGCYPAMIKQAGASSVTANNPNRENCAIMKELCSFIGCDFSVLNQSMVIFEDSQIFVDMDHKERHHYLFAQNQLLGFYNSAGQSFSDVVEACAHYVTEGLVFDWSHPKWASPPEDYKRVSFHAALRERFEYVFSCNGWLTVAVGKLPVEIFSAASPDPVGR